MIMWILRIVLLLLMALVVSAFMGVPEVTLKETAAIVGMMLFLGALLAASFFKNSKVAAGLLAGMFMFICAGMSLHRGYVEWPTKVGADIRFERVTNPGYFWVGVGAYFMFGLGSLVYSGYWLRRVRGAQPALQADAAAQRGLS